MWTSARHVSHWPWKKARARRPAEVSGRQRLPPRFDAHSTRTWDWSRCVPPEEPETCRASGPSVGRESIRMSGLRRRRWPRYVSRTPDEDGVRSLLAHRVVVRSHCSARGRWFFILRRAHAGTGQPASSQHFSALDDVGGRRMGERRAELGWERASGRRRSRRERGGSDRGMQGPCSSGRALRGCSAHGRKKVRKCRKKSRPFDISEESVE